MKPYFKDYSILSKSRLSAHSVIFDGRGQRALAPPEVKNSQSCSADWSGIGPILYLEYRISNKEFRTAEVFENNERVFFTSIFCGSLFCGS